MKVQDTLHERLVPLLRFILREHTAHLEILLGNSPAPSPFPFPYLISLLGENLTPDDPACLQEAEPIELFIAYFKQNVAYHFTLMQSLKKQLRLLDQEHSRQYSKVRLRELCMHIRANRICCSEAIVVQAVLAREKKIASLQSTFEKEFDAIVAKEKKLDADASNLRQKHQYSEVNRYDDLARLHTRASRAAPAGAAKRPY
jgi:hypothetical protein